MARRRVLAALLLDAVIDSSRALAVPFAGPRGVRRALHAASVEIEAGRCAGALAVRRDLVVTARHCVEDGARAVRVRFTTGARRRARVAAVSAVSDQAVLLLADPVPIRPLPLARRRPIPGTVFFFEGHPARPRFQWVRLERIGRCDSLPDLANALFTSVRGVPGDSGAPLVDGAGRIVGLVHGGEHCHIATPADALGRLVDDVLVEVRDSRPPGGGYSGTSRSVSGWGKKRMRRSLQYLWAMASATCATRSGAVSARTRSNCRPATRKPTAGAVGLPSMRRAARLPSRT
jgi:S1-C subfamily serine protease